MDESAEDEKEVNVTAATEADIRDIQRLHGEAGWDYAFPSLDSPLFVVKQVCRDDAGRIMGASALRIQAETYLWVDPSLPMPMRYHAIVSLHRAVIREAWKLGLDCLVAWLPPGLPKTFHNFLHKLGWNPSRPDWRTWEKAIQ